MDDHTELSLSDLFQILRRGFWFALAVAVGAAALTFFLSKRATPEYESTVTLLLSRPGSNSQGNFGVSLVTAPIIDSNAYRAAARSYPVLVGALAELGVPDPKPQLVDTFADLVTVNVESNQQSSLLRLTVRDADPLWASESANALGSELVKWDVARAKQNLTTVVETLASQVEAFDAEIAALEALHEGSAASTSQLEGLQSLRADRVMQLNSARALSVSAVGLLEVLEPARPALRPSGPRPMRNAALAFVLGIFLVYGLVLFRDAVDTRFRNSEVVYKQSELPILAEFPRLAMGVNRLPPEATGYLRTNVMFATAQDLPKVLLVTSAEANEGKTSVAIGLAESFARNDYRTLLIDADMRRPQASVRLGLTREGKGDAGTLRMRLEGKSFDAESIHIELDGALIDVIPTFEPAPAPSEMLSRSFASLLQKVKENYDVIVIDSPPVLPVADTLAMAPHATGVILAVSLQTGNRRSVQAMIDLLDRIGVRILGTAVTNVEPNRALSGSRGYGYGYGYGYGAPEKAPAEQPEIAARKRVGDRLATDDLS